MLKDCENKTFLKTSRLWFHECEKKLSLCHLFKFDVIFAFSIILLTNNELFFNKSLGTLKNNINHNLIKRVKVSNSHVLFFKLIFFNQNM